MVSFHWHLSLTFLHFSFLNAKDVWILLSREIQEAFAHCRSYSVNIP
jgi:hypothetical protein